MRVAVLAVWLFASTSYASIIVNDEYQYGLVQSPAKSFLVDSPTAGNWPLSVDAANAALTVDFANGINLTANASTFSSLNGFSFAVIQTSVQFDVFNVPALVSFRTTQNWSFNGQKPDASFSIKDLLTDQYVLNYSDAATVTNYQLQPGHYEISSQLLASTSSSGNYSNSKLTYSVVPEVSPLLLMPLTAGLFITPPIFKRTRFGVTRKEV